MSEASVDECLQLKPLLYAKSHMRRTELILHLSLIFLIFVLSEISFDVQIGRKVLNTADANLFLYLFHPQYYCPDT